MMKRFHNIAAAVLAILSFVALADPISAARAAPAERFEVTSLKAVRPTLVNTGFMRLRRVSFCRSSKSSTTKIFVRRGMKAPIRDALPEVPFPCACKRSAHWTISA